MWIQKEIQLQARSRGFHIITDEILQQLPELESINALNQRGVAHQNDNWRVDHLALLWFSS